MEVTRGVSVLKGTLAEAVAAYQAGGTQHLPTYRQAFMNGSTTQFRVAIGDGARYMGDLFFHNRELLARFTSMPHRLQYEFFCMVQAAFRESQVASLELEVPWSTNKTRIMRFWWGNTGEVPTTSMDVDLV